MKRSDHLARIGGSRALSTTITAAMTAAMTVVAMTAMTAAALELATDAAADAGERHRVFYRDRWVSYIERDGLAIHQGDIVLGDAATIAALRDGRLPLKALAVDRAAFLWPANAAGVHEVPYRYEAGNQSNIDQAIAQFNATFTGIIQWVPHTTQPDFVAFNLTATTVNTCFSEVGRVGGRQQIGGISSCPVGPLLHEMGHAIGFWHTQSDAAQGSFLDIRYAAMDPRWHDQYTPIVDARTLDGYDYASIMHYSANIQSATPDPLTAGTLPPGIDIGLRSGYSAADVDAVKRLYGAAPTTVTITSNPPGLEVLIDGVATITPAVRNWRVGSLHRLDVNPAPQTQGSFRFGFGRWSHDPSPQPAAAQEVVVDPGQGFLSEPITAPKNTVLSANFVRLVQVQPSVTGTANGTITVTPERAPWPGTTNWFPQYTAITLDAQTSPGFLHNWLTSSFFTMTGGSGGVPTATRRLAPTSPNLVGGSIFNEPAIVVKTAGTGIDGSLRANVTSPGGSSPVSTLIPNVLRTTGGGTYTITVDQTQTRSDSVRFSLISIDGLDLPETGRVALPNAGAPPKTVTVTVEKQYQPLVQRHPSCGGAVSVSPSGMWLRHGATLTATATQMPSGVVFAGWDGTMTGTGTTSNPMTLDRPPVVIAHFNSIAEPLRVASVTPSTIRRGQGPVTLRFTGSGFTAGTFLSKENGEQKPTHLIDSHTLEATLTDADFTHAGKTVVTLGNTISFLCNVFTDDIAIDVLPAVVPQFVTVHEFYNAALDRYFRTASDTEAAAIRANPATGEEDTGRPFKAWSGLAYPTGARAVFRFYGSVTPGPNSHFFTVDVAEARTLQRAELDTPASFKRWNYEELSFAVRPAQDGGCPAEAPVRIYRVYNDGFAKGKDSNHRLLTNFDDYTQMLAREWIGEGVVMCGPA